MIRVCMVAPAYMTGGQAIEAATLVRGFSHGSEVHVDLQPIDPKIPNWIARIWGIRTLARLPLFWVGLLWRIPQSDVVHVFTAAFWPFFLTTTPAVVVARMLRKPVVLNYRDGRAADHIDTWWVSKVLQMASVLVFPSGFLRDLFKERGFQGRVIYNVVDTERFPFRPRPQLQPVLLSCRLLEELYAVENTVRAYEIVREEFPEARLFIIGDGDLRSELEEMVASEKIEGVEFHGTVPHGKVPNWFDRAEILVNSSRIDNMPHSIIEAFSAGLPVVTTPSGGIPYVVEDGRNGVFVTPDDPTSMAEAVLRLLRNPTFSQGLIHEGRKDCLEKYAWISASRLWVDLYSELSLLEYCGTRGETVSQDTE